MLDLALILRVASEIYQKLKKFLLSQAKLAYGGRKTMLTFFSDGKGRKKTIGNWENHEIRASFYSLKCLNVTQPVVEDSSRIVFVGCAFFDTVLFCMG